MAPRGAGNKPRSPGLGSCVLYGFARDHTSGSSPQPTSDAGSLDLVPNVKSRSSSCVGRCVHSVSLGLYREEMALDDFSLEDGSGSAVSITKVAIILLGPLPLRGTSRATCLPPLHSTGDIKVPRVYRLNRNGVFTVFFLLGDVTVANLFLTRSLVKSSLGHLSGSDSAVFPA